MRGSFPGEFLLFLFKRVNFKPYCAVHGKAYITLSPSVHLQKDVVLGRDKTCYGIDRPGRERKLPDVLSKEEVGAMLRATKNPKHKCILALIYSCGLRRRELINLKLEDVDSKRMLIKIRGAKGKKDRYVQLANSLLPLLRNYLNFKNPIDDIID